MTEEFDPVLLGKLRQQQAYAKLGYLRCSLKGVLGDLIGPEPTIEQQVMADTTEMMFKHAIDAALELVPVDVKQEAEKTDG